MMIASPSPAACCDLGLMAYPAAHALQVELAARRRQGALGHDLFLCVEHPPVYTLGRHGSRAHLGEGEDFLRERGIAVMVVERGGEITYHGPGQLVVYPILDLRRRRLGLRDYVYLLEELMLRLAADCGIAARRDPRNHGVWVGDSKLGSIGIAIRHGVAFHGLALNVDPDLEPFSWINPCGLTGIGMTSLAREGGHDCTMARLKALLPRHLADLFAVDLHFLGRDRLLAGHLSVPNQP
ncbi:lipoyl(octanoyl) transferase LipB [Desulfobulbus elongatus]|uniref:lipoyl(octanoyl) transferase LipB n=1 Tax=Desulfobulbus elongatus TaxID=53332 RepID=UPI001FE13112|nr:lipoyl(octanoyl) transferase LipB [Desulfobulbus elongatus]